MRAGWMMALLLLPASASADEVVLHNGQHYIGIVEGMDRNQVVLRDANGVEMRIPRTGVRDIRIAQPAKEPRSGMGRAESGHRSDRPESAAELHESDSGGRGSLLSRLFGGRNQGIDAFRDAPRMTLEQALKANDGQVIRLRGRYGRLRAAATGTPQSSSVWFLNDGARELRVVGHVPEGLSSFSREHWGSEVEVAGRIEDGVLHALASRLIRKRQSPMPTRN